MGVSWFHFNQQKKGGGTLAPGYCFHVMGHHWADLSSPNSSSSPPFLGSRRRGAFASPPTGVSGFPATATSIFALPNERNKPEQEALGRPLQNKTKLCLVTALVLQRTSSLKRNTPLHGWRLWSNTTSGMNLQSESPQGFPSHNAPARACIEVGVVMHLFWK